MSSDYIKNGNFNDDLKYWRSDDPDFEPYFDTYGQSLLLPLATRLVQKLPDLPYLKKLRLEFDAQARDSDPLPGNLFVSVAGVDKEGITHSTPIIPRLTDQWQRFMAPIEFSVPVTQCHVIISMPTPAYAVGSDEEQKSGRPGPVKISNLRLIDEE